MNEIMTRFCGHCGIKFEGTAEVIVELSLCHIVAEHPEEVAALMVCSDPVVRTVLEGAMDDELMQLMRSQR